MTEKIRVFGLFQFKLSPARMTDIRKLVIKPKSHFNTFFLLFSNSQNYSSSWIFELRSWWTSNLKVDRLKKSRCQKLNICDIFCHGHILLKNLQRGKNIHGILFFVCIRESVRKMQVIQKIPWEFNFGRYQLWPNRTYHTIVIKMTFFKNNFVSYVLSKNKSKCHFWL